MASDHSGVTTSRSLFAGSLTVSVAFLSTKLTWIGLIISAEQPDSRIAELPKTEKFLMIGFGEWNNRISNFIFVHANSIC
jgi:hypothetical protein